MHLDVTYVLNGLIALQECREPNRQAVVGNEKRTELEEPDWNRTELGRTNNKKK